MKRSIVVHPFLFAAFPVLFLFAHNLHLFHVRSILAPLVIVLCLVLFLWMALSVALKSREKAGLVISLFLLPFFSYESSYDAVRDSVARVDLLVGWFIRLGIGRAGLRGSLLALFVVIFCLGTYLLIRTRRSLHNLTLVANVVASALVVMTLIDIASYEVRIGSGWRRREVVETMDIAPAEPAATETLPDIYYIILDGYARADVLEELYQHDNTDFLEDLSGRGFYVASESRSNYHQTYLSLASSLNMTYLDDLAARVGLEYRSRTPAANMIWYSDVMRFLKHFGYTTVAFSTGWWGTEITDADVYLSPRWQPDFFQVELIGMTPLPFLARQVGVQAGHDAHRERISYTFDKLAELSELDGPLFVFAHVVAPHPPFVFGRHGEEIEPESRFTLRDGDQIIRPGTLTQDEYVRRYRDQLTYTNGRVRQTIDGILSGSERPVIIILQADHGPGSTLNWEDVAGTDLRERFSILNAYYLPEQGEADLYEGITPVNTFRLVFNRYFGANYELLRDESYFSTFSRPYAFLNVTDEIDDIR